MNRGSISAVFCVSAACALALAGCTPTEIEWPEPGESARVAIEAKLASQQDVGGLPMIPTLVLHVVVSRADPTAETYVALAPNTRATLSRMGRLITPPTALVQSGTYFAVTDMHDEFVFLARVGDAPWLIGEGLTADLTDEATRFDGVASGGDGYVIAARVPLVLGGVFSVFTTDGDAGVVDDLLVVIPFGLDGIPKAGRLYKVAP